MTARGVAAPTAASAAAPTSGYVVQLGAYNNEVYALNRVNQLKQMGLSNVFYRTVQKPDGQVINRVYAGTFASMAEAQTASRLIQGNYQIAGIVSSL
jgi:cell division septation protein DedD